MKKIFSDEQIKYILENYQNKSYSEIGNALGFTERQVRGKINGMGLRKLKTFNSSYFHSIDTPHKAYWLGFIYADGCIISSKENRKYELTIEVDENDSYILDELNKELTGNHEIKIRNREIKFNGYTYTSHTARIRVYSKEVVSDLINNGIVSNKTNSEVYPHCTNYVRDFVRGFLDGDGCISIKDDCHGFPSYALLSFVNSNSDFLSYLNELIIEEVRASGKIYKEKDKKYKLYYCGQDSIGSILKWLYDDADLFLIRKYKKYQLVSGLAA